VDLYSASSLNSL